MSKKVGLILINYQDYAQRFLTAFCGSFRRQNYPQELTHIYIVDNASTPETVNYLNQTYPEAKILTRSDGNYVAANNLGCQEAIKDGCEYLVVVNMDTEMEVGWLRELVKALEENSGAGIAQSKILLYPKNNQERTQLKINSLGNIIHFLGFGFTDGYSQPDREIIGYPEIKGYASGCSFIVRREVFERIGGWNEEFYMYHDDLEFNLKAKLAGYQVILAPQSIIYHKYEFKRSTRMIYYMERNRYLTLLLFYPKYLFLLIGLPGMMMDVAMFFYSLINGWFREELKIYGYFCQLANYRRLHTERMRIKQLSLVKFSKLAKSFSGKISFQEISNPILQYIVNPLFGLYWWLVKKMI